MNTSYDRRWAGTGSRTALKPQRVANKAGYAPRLWAGLLFVLALLARLYQPGNQSLWLDEGSTWQIIQQDWGTLLLELFSPVSAYPLYHVLLKGWVALAGDSEWSLRFPSVVAGAAAVVALAGTAAECARGTTTDDEHDGAGLVSAFPIAAACLLLFSPFATWYAQEAKVYSLFLLCSTLLLWSLLRAVRLNTRHAWVHFALIVVISVFVHRLAVLLIVASVVAIAAVRVAGRAAPQHHASVGAGARGILYGSIGLLAGGGIVLAMVMGLGSEGASTGAHIPASPGLALWLTFVRFSMDRGPGEFPWWWLLPWAALTLWGLLTLARDIRAHASPPALVLLCFLLVPLLLFLAQLVFTRFYEARYLMVIFPAWVLVLASPVRKRGKRSWDGVLSHTIVHGVAVGLVAAALLVSVAVLFQPEKGLFSGDPVKEQYREIFEILAQRVHPDDVIVLHPAYMEPLYRYYMQRLTTDHPPAPALFAAFKQGQTEFTRKDWDAARKETFAGHLRSFLVIAPDHARTVDIPNALYNDEYGLVGIYYQYSFEEKKWPCGIWRFNGVHLYCQESPEAYETGEVPRPSTPMDARFGTTMHLLGYTLKPVSPDRPGVYRAGGTIPISLYWDVVQQPDQDYHMFLHLCQECDQPPVASNDGSPLDGYLPTSTWLPGKPARDDRALPLPRNLPTGRYTLLLGLYQPSDPSPDARLSLEAGAGQAIEHNRLVLGTVDVVGQ